MQEKLVKGVAHYCELCREVNKKLKEMEVDPNYRLPLTQTVVQEVAKDARMDKINQRKGEFQQTGETATRKQIDFMKDKGIKFESDITKSDASDKISKYIKENPL